MRLAGLCDPKKKDGPQGLKAGCFAWIYVRAKARTYLSLSLTPSQGLDQGGTMPFMRA